MSGAFQYRPKFVDIRVRPPTADEEEERARAEDVLRLKPGEKPCEWPGCSRAGEAKAPKARELPGEFYRFCQPHAAEYNKNWNFFAGMSPGEQQKWREEAVTGHRPTWQFRASRLSREAAGAAAKGPKGFVDPFTIFGAGRARGEPEQPAPARRLGKIERQALADLDLDSEADGPKIRARYTELVKRCHPDANGGDRSTEQRLQRVIAAYKTLKKAGLA
jgi:hypothetical protein